MTETTLPLVTDDDLDCLDTLKADGTIQVSDLYVLAPRQRARWVAEALAAACERIVADCSHGDIRMGEWPAPTCPFCQPKANSVATLADEYRDGRR